MKTLFGFCGLLVLALYSNPCIAQSDTVKLGTINGGGGRGVYCADPKIMGTKLMTLDLYESKFVYQQKLLDEPKNFLAALALSLQKLQGHYEEYKGQFPPVTSDVALNYKKKFLDSKIKKLPLKHHLDLYPDSYEPVLPKGCKPVQIAYYYQDEYILIDQSYYKLLSPLNKAAIMMHELIYLERRVKFRENNSLNTRRFVGLLLSKEPFATIHQDIPYLIRAEDPREVIHCKSNGVENLDGSFSDAHIEFYIYQDKINPFNSIFQFVQFEGEPPLFRMKMEDTGFNLLEYKKKRSIYEVYTGGIGGSGEINSDVLNEKFKLDFVWEPITEEYNNGLHLTERLRVKYQKSNTPILEKNIWIEVTCN